MFYVANTGTISVAHGFDKAWYCRCHELKVCTQIPNSKDNPNEKWGEIINFLTWFEGFNILLQDNETCSMNNFHGYHDSQDELRLL